jgi:hypothetical protein
MTLSESCSGSTHALRVLKVEETFKKSSRAQKEEFQKLFSSDYLNNLIGHSCKTQRDCALMLSLVFQTACALAESF